MTFEEIGARLSPLLNEYGTALITTVIGVFALWFRDRILRFLSVWWTALVRIQAARKAIASDAPWLIHKPRSRADLKASRIPIITFANLKGGVGKTTLAANIAGFFASQKSKRNSEVENRVLLIDLDFQGSLSSMILEIDQRIPAHGSLSKASKLIAGNLDADAICDAPYSKDSDRIHGIAAHYDLARIETRIFMQWLIRDFSKDLRYIMRDVLTSERVQEKYDVIIIDAPPRLTTAAIQALCASTHLFVPTKLDAMSGDAVSSFLEQLEELRPLWPSLRFSGVIGTMVQEIPDGGNLPSKTERYGEDVVKTNVAAIYNARNLEPPSRVMLARDTYISDSEHIRRYAGDGIALFRLANNAEHVRVKEMIGRLGRAIQELVQ